MATPWNSPTPSPRPEESPALSLSADAESLFHSFFQSAGTVVVLLSPKLRILDWNPEAERLLGYRRGEVLGKPYLEMFVREDLHEEMEEKLGKALAGTPLHTVEGLARTREGEWRILLWNVSRYLDDSGKPAGLIAMGQDITESKRAQRALSDSETQLRVITDSLPAMIAYIDARERYRFVNRRYAEYFGRKPAEVVGMQVEEVLGDSYPRVKPYIEAALSGKKSSYEMVFDADGVERVFSAVVVPDLDEGGESCGYFVLVNDVTSQKEVERDLRRAKEAAEAANAQLEEAIERANRMALEAEAANCAKSEFLANMSHEIRTPMNGIIGMTDLTMETDLDEDQREYLQMVRSSAKHLLRLINDILDFSKIEAGRFEMEEAPFCLADCIRDTLNSVVVPADKPLELVCDLPLHVPGHLMGDPGRLRQILLNLLSNAIKFTEEGEIVLKIDCKRETEDEVVLLFSVRDSGIGIGESQQKVIFQAFSQADGSTTRKYGGTGLGLAIAKELVNRMGGEIWVESEPELGSTFHFTARLGKAPGKPPPDDEDLQKVSLEGRRVLIAEGNSTARGILAKTFKAWRMHPDAVGDAREALEAVKSAEELGEPYDLLLLDDHLGNFEAFQLSERIRKEARSQSAIILSTRTGIRGDAERCRELGVGAYLLKPVTSNDLLRTVRSVLRDSHPETPRRLVTRHTLREDRPRLKVLLGEDNPVNMKLALRLLEKRGYQVVSLGDGKSVVERAASEEFDIILMDIQMPKMDGLEATEAIRRWEEREGRKRVPIVALTAHAMKGDRERCLQAGMDGYVTKPIQPQELFEAMESLTTQSARAPHDSAKGEAGARLFDRERLLERVDHDRELLGEIVELFLEDYPTLVGGIAKALEKGDAHELERSAHALKGSVGNFMAECCQQAAYRLEKLGREKRLEEAPRALEDLERELERLRPALQELASESSQ